MPKKLTYEFVKGEFEKEGYVLLSDSYANSKQKLEYICSNGHKYKISWGSWSQGCRCAVCSGNAELDVSFVRSVFKKEGYILLSDKYINSKSKLEYICPNKHRHFITWNEWQSGNRCYYCSGKQKYTIDYIRDVFSNKGFVLLSTKYINNSTKLKYRCPIGHTHSITFTNFINGHGCPSCKILNQTGLNNHNWKGGISCAPYCDAWADKEYKESIKERDGYKCLNPCCNSNNPNDLNIHHIDYNKKRCAPNNLITLCRSCNSKANHNRDWHVSWYKYTLLRRYGYCE